MDFKRPNLCPQIPTGLLREGQQSHGPIGLSLMSMDENKINAEQSKQVFITFI